MGCDIVERIWPKTLNGRPGSSLAAGAEGDDRGARFCELPRCEVSRRISCAVAARGANVVVLADDALEMSDRIGRDTVAVQRWVADEAETKLAGTLNCDSWANNCWEIARRVSSDSDDGTL